MGIISIIVIALTAIALVFGTLYGFKRARNRSILRLVLILGCVAGAIFLRAPLIEFLMETNLAKDLLQSLTKEKPEGFQMFMLVLTGVVLNVLVYFIIFFVLRLISWLIIYPIFKIFIKTEVDRKRGWGALIGLVQGVVIAFAVLVPLNGLAVQLDRLSQVKIEMPADQGGGAGEQAGQNPNANKGFSLAIPEGLGLSEYVNSDFSKMFGTIGGWYFDMITTVQVTKDIALNFNDACDMTISMAGVMASTNEINKGIDSIKSGTATDKDKEDLLKTAGSTLSEVGENIDSMKEQAKELLKIIVEKFGSGEGEGLNINLDEVDFSSLGKTFTSLGNYYENGRVTLEEAKNVVDGIVDNWSIIQPMISSGTLIDMNGESEEHFKTALEQVEESQKKTIMEIFGITA